MSKLDKRLGLTLPRDAKHPHPDEDRVTPKAVPVAPAKRYGFSHRYWKSWAGIMGHRRHYQWYKTERARNQAFDLAVKRKNDAEAQALKRFGEDRPYFMQDFRKEER